MTEHVYCSSDSALPTASSICFPWSWMQSWLPSSTISQILGTRRGVEYACNESWSLSSEHPSEAVPLRGTADGAAPAARRNPGRAQSSPGGALRATRPTSPKLGLALLLALLLVCTCGERLKSFEHRIGRSVSQRAPRRLAAILRVSDSRKAEIEAAEKHKKAPTANRGWP